MPYYPSVHYIKSSAGSGKTYRLTLKFLELLHILGKPSREKLKSLIAITFTNKAANEMKERIVRALKEIAFETQKGRTLAGESQLRPKEAREWLEVIIDNFTCFNIRTIDSFIYLIMRAVSLEMGLPRESEVVFDKNYAINLAFDRVLLETNSIDFSLLKRLINTFLWIEARGGFKLELGIKRTLINLYRELGDLETSFSFYEKRQEIYTRIREKHNEFLKIIEKSGLERHINKNFLNSLKGNNFLQGILKKPTVQWNKTLLKKCPSEKIVQIEQAYYELYQLIKKYFQVAPYAKVEAYAAFLNKIKEEMKNIFSQEGLILSGQWIEFVRSYLKGGISPSYALFKLGLDLKHFLIDEFQDTSVAQWDILFLVLEEALAQGGFFFLVGDAKQSIYSWRGGDWRLFERIVEERPFRCVSRGQYVDDVLIHNWRSAEGIVEFNNQVFRRLKEEEFVEALVKRFMREEDNEIMASLKADIKKIYDNVDQKVGSERQKRIKAKIECRFLKGKEYEEYLLRDLASLWQEDQEIAILVRTNALAEEVASLLIEQGYPVVTENSLKIKNSKAVRAMVCLLRFLHNHTDMLALYGFLNSPLTEGLIDKLVLKDLIFSSSNLAEAVKGSFPDFWANYFLPLKQLAASVSPYILLREIAERFKVCERLKEEKVFINRFFELAYMLENEKKTLSAILDALEEEAFEEKIGLPEKIKAIRVLTIHKAKGLEFETVLLPVVGWYLKEDVYMIVNKKLAYVTQGDLLIPFKREKLKERAKNLIEMLNLIYVAFTRAKKALYLYVETPQRNYKNRAAASIVRMLLESKDKRCAE